MDDFCAVSHHFIHGIFNIATGTPVASRIADKLNVHPLVSTERTFPVPQGSEAFSACTPMVTITNDYPYFFLLFHVTS
jgi:hypothetical protein